MTIFSVVLIAILIIGLLRKSLKKVFTYFLTVSIALTLNLRMGYFFMFKGIELGYGSVVIYFTAMIAFLYLIQTKIILKPLSVIFFGLIVFFVVNVICFYIFPYTGKVIATDWEKFCRGEDVWTTLSSSSLQMGYYATLISLGIILLCGKKTLDRSNWLKILNNVLFVCKINIILGIIEFFVKNIFQSQIVTDCCIKIFGSYGAQQNELDLRGLFYTIQGATKEASMYTTTMFYTALLFLVKGKLTNKKDFYRSRIWLFISVVMLLINTTMSSVLYLGLLGLIGFGHNLILKKKRGGNGLFIIGRVALLAVSGVLCAVIFANYSTLLKSDNYIIRRIGRAAEQVLLSLQSSSNNQYSSESIRFTGIFYDLRMWLKKPLIGFGFGTLVCNSGIVTMLVNVGLIGVILWFLFLLFFGKSGKNTCREVVFLVEIWILPSLILNDYETILCLVIPLLLLLYGYIVEGQKIVVSELKQPTLATTFESKGKVI